MAQITASNLTLAYDGVEVVSNLNMEICRGDYLCIIGENGSGKSTLTKAILGLISPAGGTITYGDGLRRNEIGYLPQQTSAQRDFPASVQEIVFSGCQNKLGILPFYNRSHRKTVAQTMETLGISDIRSKCYNQLSGGQQQRVLLARALCATDKILILDEPVAGLDPVITSEFYDIISKLNKEHGITIVMVSHDLDAVRLYATKVLHMRDKEYVFDTAIGYMNSKTGRHYLGGDGK